MFLDTSFWSRKYMFILGIYWLQLAAPLRKWDKVVTSDKCGSLQMIQALTSLTRASPLPEQLQMTTLLFPFERFDILKIWLPFNWTDEDSSWQHSKMLGITKLLQDIVLHYFTSQIFWGTCCCCTTPH